MTPEYSGKGERQKGKKEIEAKGRKDRREGGEREGGEQGEDHLRKRSASFPSQSSLLLYSEATVIFNFSPKVIYLFGETHSPGSSVQDFLC